MSTDSREPRQTLWAHPALLLSLGTVLAVAAWLGGRPGWALIFFGSMALVTVAWWVAVARSQRFRETFQADERWNLVDLRAGRLAAVAMLGVLFAGAVYEIAQGRALSPFATLVLCVGSLTYTGAQVFLSRRS